MSCKLTGQQREQQQQKKKNFEGCFQTCFELHKLEVYPPPPAPLPPLLSLFFILPEGRLFCMAISIPEGSALFLLSSPLEDNNIKKKKHETPGRMPRQCSSLRMRWRNYGPPGQNLFATSVRPSSIAFFLRLAKSNPCGAASNVTNICTQERRKKTLFLPCRSTSQGEERGKY